MTELTTSVTAVDVVEVIAPPHAVTEVVGLAAGLVEVHDIASALISVEQPDTQILQIVTPGPPGPRGPIGPQGPQGPYAPIFEQYFASPQIQWVIHHDLDAYPVVTLYDLNHEEINGDITTPDRNTVVVDFQVPFAGTARLKA